VTTNPNTVVDRALKSAASPTRPPARALRSPGPKAAILAALHWLGDADGSDLHLAAAGPPLARVDGTIAPVPSCKNWSADFVEAALKSLMTDDLWARFEHELELNFAVDLPDARYRITVYRQRGQVGGALRRIPPIRSVAELGLPEQVGAFADLPRGLVLVTGRTGTGKSSTLAALIDRINHTRPAHVMTVEDPVEFVHPRGLALVNQREVGVDTRDYPTALRQALRQDPDVILLGELRDLETISGALTAAETGHLVLATLHTQSAPQTIDRIVDVFPAHQQDQVRAQLALTLKAVVSQTLLPRATGQGRVPAAEVMITTPAISNLIREGKHHQLPTVLMSGVAQGMRSMDQALAALVLAGTVTAEAAFSVAQDRAVLTGMLRADPSTWVPTTPADLRRSA
jgi:twitching motility protein PilT